jgi:hypothetical protein
MEQQHHDDNVGKRINRSSATTRDTDLETRCVVLDGLVDEVLGTLAQKDIAELRRACHYIANGRTGLLEDAVDLR